MLWVSSLWALDLFHVYTALSYKLFQRTPSIGDNRMAPFTRNIILQQGIFILQRFSSPWGRKHLGCLSGERWALGKCFCLQEEFQKWVNWSWSSSSTDFFTTGQAFHRGNGLEFSVASHSLASKEKSCVQAILLPATFELQLSSANLLLLVISKIWAEFDNLEKAIRAGLSLFC